MKKTFARIRRSIEKAVSEVRGEVIDGSGGNPFADALPDLPQAPAVSPDGQVAQAARTIGGPA